MTKTTNTRTKSKPRYSKRALRLRRELFLSLLVILFGLFLVIKFHSSPTTYKVVVYDESNQMDLIQYYTDFKAAKQEMQMQLDQGKFNPAILSEDDRILSIRYGVVNFKTKTCGENTSFTYETRQKNGYTNGCYGADGAYLETDDKASSVRFKQSGAVGWVDIDDVQILNYYDPQQVASINHYTIEEENIMHYGTMDITQDQYELYLSIGENSVGLEPSKQYYSYDGHYFYETYSSMIDDYRRNLHDNSKNTQPYFNYYQYLSHRSKTLYVSKDINGYISNYLGYRAKPTSYPPNTYESQLYDEGYSFVEAQNTYGVNAMMMLALAINESGLGRSQIAIEKNNLFGHAAYDNAPNESANGYKDVAAGIATHASIFLNKGYLNPCDQAPVDSEPKASTCLTISGNRYAGGYYGDKGSGMNVNYASDPYWGEKAASYYRTMDQVLGEKDKDRYDIKVLRNQNQTAYGSLNTSSSSLFTTPSYDYYAVTVVEELEGEAVEGNTTWYKIQSDAVLNEARNKLIASPEKYNTKNDIVYMPAAWFY